MKYKYGLIFICLIICLFSIASVCASEVNETLVASEDQSDEVITVEDNNDIITYNDQVTDGNLSDSKTVYEVGTIEENKLSTTPGTFTDLANDIENARDELNLTRDYIYSSDDIIYQDGITINKKITINGNGFNINANSQSKIFIISHDNVNINSISFLNSNSNKSLGNGGSLYWVGNYGSVVNCSFVNCFTMLYPGTQNRGGVIHWAGINGSIINCSFNNCFFKFHQGYSSSTVYGGIAYWSGVNGSIINSSFINCNYLAKNSFRCDGGVFYWNSTNGILLNCKFISCSSIRNGGAIYLIDNNCSIMNCIFNNCSTNESISNSGGGAIYCGGSNSYLMNCSFINCYSREQGGAVRWIGNEGLIKNCIFFNDTSKATYYGGGAIYVNGKNVNLTNCTFNKCSNKGYYDGGAVCWRGNKGLLKDSTFIECFTDSSYYSAGAINWDGNQGTLSNCSFIKCKTTTQPSGASAIYWTGYNGHILNSNFSQCVISYTTDSSYGGTIDCFGKFNLISNCNFEYCSSNSNNRKSASGIYVYGDNNTVSHSNFTNKFNQENLVIYWEGTNGSLYGCEFNGNKVNYSPYIKAENKLDFPAFLHVDNIVVGDNAKINVIFNLLTYKQSILYYYNLFNTSEINTIGGVFFNNSETMIELHNLDYGKYYLCLEFPGDEIYNQKTIDTYFIVGKSYSPDVTIRTDENITAGNNLTIKIISVDIINGTVYFYMDNATHYSPMINGESKISILKPMGGNRTYSIEIVDDSKLNSIFLINSININFKNTLIQFDNATINFGENIILNPIVSPNATGIISIFIDNKFESNIIVGKNYSLCNLNAGLHKIDFIYNGDSYFNSQNLTTYVIVKKIDTYLNVSSVNLKAGNIIITTTLDNRATGNITIELNKCNYNNNISNGNSIINIIDLIATNYTCNITYSGDSNFNPISKLYEFEIHKFDANFNITVNNITLNNNSYLKIWSLTKNEVIFNFISNTDITGEINFYQKNLSGYNCKLINGVAEIIIPNIKAGFYNYNITYDGDLKYNSFCIFGTLEILLKNPNLDFNVSNILYGDNLTFSPKITPGASGNFDVLFDGSFIGNFSVGETFNHLILNGGIHHITIRYSGDEYFASAEVTKEFEVYRLNTTVNITDKLEANKSAIINVTLNEDAIFGVSITINSRKYSIDLVDGVATFNVPNLGGGIYDVIIEYEGDSKYAPFTITKQVNVTYKISSIDLDIYNIYIGDSFIVNSIVNSDATGTLSIYLDDIFKKSISVGSKYTISDLNAGKYEVRVKYNGDNYYAPSEKTIVFRVLTIDPIDVNDMQIVYGTNNYFHAKFYDEYGEVLANKYVIFKVNGSDYSSRTDSDGIAYLNENLELGSYEVITINPFVNENRTNNLLIFSSVIAEDMVRAYNSGIDFKATFLDEHAKPLANTPILFKINGEDKVVSTDSNGVAILNVPLSVGTYTITSINTITDENKTNQLIVTPSIQSSNMIRAYNSSVDYKAIFLDNDAKPLCNTEIIFEVNSNQYRVITDNNGQAILNIALIVGKYNITSINPVTSEKSKRNLTIVERIVENQDMLIGMGSDSYYRVRIVDDDASFVGKDEIVTFTINNHNYYIKTDSKGYAALKITENSGSHTITAKYKGFIVSNNIDIIQSIDSIMSIDVNDTEFNSKVIINVFTSPNYQTGNITITITGNNGYYNMFTQKASQIITKELTGLNVSSYNVNVKYVDFENYHVSEEAKTFNVLKINPNIILTTDDAEYGQNATVTVNIPQVEGTVVIKIGDDITYTDYLIEDGVIIKRISTLPAGEYKVSVTFNGNDNYKKYTRYTTLNITKSFATFNVFAQDVEYGSNIKVLVSADLDGKATIKIDEETKTINLQANNEVEVIFSTLAIGKYKIYSTFSPIDSNNYYEEIDESNVEVTKIENIDVEIPNTVQNEDNVLSFNLPSDATGTITITINGNDYSTEVENGVVNINLPDLINGNYDYTITYSGDEKYSSFTSVGSITVNNVISTVKARNMTINYGNEIDFQATFFESDGSPLANKYIVFMIGSTEYPVKTDANGLAILKIGLTPGEYYITSINTKTDETKLNRLIVKSIGPKPIDEKDINVPVLSGGFSTIKLPNDATGTITLNIAGKNYNFDVVNGVANVKVPELTNGNYPYTITYSGDDNYLSFSKTGSLTVNKQTTPSQPESQNPTTSLAKITITLKTVKVKKSAKKLVLQATLKQGKNPLKNKKITFKFNGKKYTAKTNKNGVAKVTIIKSVLKKLKVGKKVKYQASYGNKVIAKKTAKVKK